MTFSFLTLSYALLGGLLPALGWVWFFAHEDPHPEPRSLLIKTFIAGMVAVPIAMGLEEIFQQLLGSSVTNQTLLGWSFIEEAVKLLAVWLVAFRSRFMDEPIDAVIYMLTAALGFAALENALFLLSPLASSAYLNTILTGSLRFLGATLVHVAASGLLGALIAASFYRQKRIKVESAVIGLLMATLLHWGFNLLIIEAAQATILRIFALVWMVVIALMLVFERVKQIKRPAPYSPIK